MPETMLYSGTLVIETCCRCAINFAMPAELRDACLRDHSKSFYCPVGHGQAFVGETAEQKLKRQLEQARTNTRWYSDQLTSTSRDLRAEQRSKAALKGHLTRARNKIAAGNCPVPDCGQHFSNVREHMKFKHPDYQLTDPETGKKADL